MESTTYTNFITFLKCTIVKANSQIGSSYNAKHLDFNHLKIFVKCAIVKANSQFGTSYKEKH